MANRRIPDAKIIEALAESMGVISVAAHAIHCNRCTISERIKTSKKVAAAYEELCETRLDLAESKLLEALDNGEPWAIKFFLTMKGAPRGYSETHTLEVGKPRDVIREEIGDAKVKRLLAMRIGNK